MRTNLQRFRASAILLRVLLVVSLFVCQSCTPAAPEAKPLPVAQWQFIDAETMRPIEGAFVNFAWRGKPTDRGLQTCKRGILGRSGKDGWFRDTALDSSWHVDPTPAFFVPGYEFFTYRYNYPKKDQITHYVKQDANSEFGRFPAWEKRWSEMGYKYQGEKSSMYLDWHAWTKVLPSKGFHDFKTSNPRLFFMKMRTMPGQVEAAFPFVGKICDDSGATNNVNSEFVAEADYLRGYNSTNYFCDPAWNSLKPGQWDMGPWIMRALFFIRESDRPKVNKDVQKILSKFYAGKTARNLTAEERSNFCRYLQQFLKPGDLL